MLDGNIFDREGFLKLCHDPVDREEIILKELSAGEYANVNSFFSYTICTHTLVPATEAKLTYLEKDVLTRWQSEFPRIEAKLKRFCHRKGTTLHELIQKVGMDLRAHKRVKTTSTAKDKEAEKVFKRELSRKLPNDLQRMALRKLRMLNRSASINDLRVPPANRQGDYAHIGFGLTRTILTSLTPRSAGFRMR